MKCFEIYKANRNPNGKQIKFELYLPKIEWKAEGKNTTIKLLWFILRLFLRTQDVNNIWYIIYADLRWQQPLCIQMCGWPGNEKAIENSLNENIIDIIKIFLSASPSFFFLQPHFVDAMSCVARNNLW